MGRTSIGSARASAAVLVLLALWGCGAQRKADTQRLSKVRSSALVHLAAPIYTRQANGLATSPLVYRTLGIEEAETRKAMAKFVAGLGKSGRRWVPVESVGRDRAYRSLPPIIQIPDDTFMKALDRIFPYTPAQARDVAESLGVDLVLGVDCRLVVDSLGAMGALTLGESDHRLRMTMSVIGYGSDGEMVFRDSELPALGTVTWTGMNGLPTKAHRAAYMAALDDVFEQGGLALSRKLSEVSRASSEGTGAPPKKKRRARRDDDDDE